MARSVEELEREVRSLDTEQRNQLLRDLISDIDGKPEREVHKAWVQEAKRRHKELQDGLVEPKPVDEVVRNARSRLKNES